MSENQREYDLVERPFCAQLEAMRELLTRTLVRDLNRTGVGRPGGERDLAQRLVALAKENHESLTRA